MQLTSGIRFTLSTIYACIALLHCTYGRSGERSGMRVLGKTRD